MSGNGATRGRFGPEQRRALQELLGLPPRPKKSSISRTGYLEIAVVRAALDLPEPSCRAWLAPDRWLVGGAVLHWLRSRPGGEGPVDYDFFYSSLNALNRGVADFLAAGFTFSCFQLWGSRCPFCGQADSLVSRDAAPPTVVPLAKAGCRVCEPTGGVGRWGSELRITAETLAASGLVAIDLLSPRGEVFQLAAIAFEPGPGRLLESSDYSVCQLGLDDRNLYFGRHTWTDLLSGRLRVENLHRTCYARLRKYMGKGFSPDPATLARVLGFHLYHRVRDRLARRAGS
jgi:hypothetical protein